MGNHVPFENGLTMPTKGITSKITTDKFSLPPVIMLAYFLNKFPAL